MNQWILALIILVSVLFLCYSIDMIVQIAKASIAGNSERLRINSEVYKQLIDRGESFMALRMLMVRSGYDNVPASNTPTDGGDKAD